MQRPNNLLTTDDRLTGVVTSPGKPVIAGVRDR